VLGELEPLSCRLNVYRGHLLEVAQTPMGGVSLGFPYVAAPPTSSQRSLARPSVCSTDRKPPP